MSRYRHILFKYQPEDIVNYVLTLKIDHEFAETLRKNEQVLNNISLENRTTLIKNLFSNLLKGRFKYVTSKFYHDEIKDFYEIVSPFMTGFSLANMMFIIEISDSVNTIKLRHDESHDKNKIEKNCKKAASHFLLEAINHLKLAIPTFEDLIRVLEKLDKDDSLEVALHNKSLIKTGTQLVSTLKHLHSYDINDFKKKQEHYWYRQQCGFSFLLPNKNNHCMNKYLKRKILEEAGLAPEPEYERNMKAKII